MAIIATMSTSPSGRRAVSPRYVATITRPTTTSATGGEIAASPPARAAAAAAKTPTRNRADESPGRRMPPIMTLR